MATVKQLTSLPQPGPRNPLYSTEIDNYPQPPIGRCLVSADLNLGNAMKMENGAVSRIREGYYTLVLGINNDFTTNWGILPGLKFFLTYRTNGQIHAVPMGGSNDPGVHFNSFIRPGPTFGSITATLMEGTIAANTSFVNLTTNWSVNLTFTTIP